MDSLIVPATNTISDDNVNSNSSVAHDHNYLENLSDVSSDFVTDLDNDKTMPDPFPNPVSSVVINDVVLPNVIPHSPSIPECDQIIDSLLENESFLNDVDLNASLNTIPQDILDIIFDAIDTTHGEDPHLHRLRRSDAVDDLTKF